MGDCLSLRACRKCSDVVEDSFGCPAPPLEARAAQLHLLHVGVKWTVDRVAAPRLRFI